MQTQPKKMTSREIHHGAFLSQGRMVAFPACFPGATTPIAMAESSMMALDLSPNGDIYGATQGDKVHLFVGQFRGVTGAIFDMGVVPDADRCAAICSGKEHFVALVNGPKGGRLVASTLQPLPFDLIQEWGFTRRPFEDWGRVGDSEPLIHAVPNSDRGYLLGLSSRHLFLVDFTEKKVHLMGEIQGRGRIVSLPGNRFIGQDEDDTLWLFEGQERRWQRRAVPLPKGISGQTRLRWAVDAHRSGIYLSDDRGQLFFGDADLRFSQALGQAPLSPVATISVTWDGRLFGACGEEMAHIFCYDPKKKEVSDLGVAVSILERRRYGYVFSDSVTGKDGEIYFAENDNLGHLWIYFPRIEPSV